MATEAMILHVWLLPRLHHLKSRPTDFQLPPGSEKHWEDGISTLKHTQARLEKKAQGEGSKIQAKSNFQVSRLIYIHISHILGLCVPGQSETSI